MKKLFSLLAIAGVSAVLVASPVRAEDIDTSVGIVAPKHAELKDGTKLDITPEGVVSVIGKDGKGTPAPDGTHELKDGKKITTKGGKVVE
jgi:hypothetical protein